MCTDQRGRRSVRTEAMKLQCYCVKQDAQNWPRGCLPLTCLPKRGHWPGFLIVALPQDQPPWNQKDASADSTS